MGENDSIFQGGELRKSKVVKIFSVFQIMYYTLHNGRKKTPLQIMAGHSIYETCKSRELLTSFNRIAASISYNEVRRDRSNFAKYTYMNSMNDQVPIPSHFTKEQFTIGAFDNFDSADRSSATGKMSTHDTVSVLFQIKPNVVQKKPPLSTLKVNEANFSDLDRLPCQNLQSFKRGIKSLELPSSFSVDDKVLSLQDVQNDLANTEFLINIVRNSSNIHIETLPTWAGCHSLTSHKFLSCMLDLSLLYHIQLLKSNLFILQ